MIHKDNYVYPQEIWDEETCRKHVKHVHKDGLGTPYPWPGYVGHLIRESQQFNGGTTIGDDWYPGVTCVPPAVPAGFELIRVRTWGWRLVIRKSTITIWTQAYRPFMMGGNVHAGIKTQVEAEGPFDLGKGYQGYLLSAPWGDLFVAEAQSGGLIGPDLKTVRADVASADPEVMKGQIEWALKELKGCTAETPETFWQMVKRAKPTKEPADEEPISRDTV